jgi:hypothetical protein
MSALQAHKLVSVGAIFKGLIDPTVTEYRGVTMRSKLETHFARHLDDEGIAWVYEPGVFGRYLPDFQLNPDAGELVFVEVKPRLRDVPGAKRRMRSIWKVHPGALLIVACGEGCTYYGAQGGPPWTSWVERWAH